MNKRNERIPGLKIDFREQRSGIIEEIGKLSDNFAIEIVELPAGDYWIDDKIIIERKTLSDFLNCIKNGRIFQQAYRIAQSGKNGLIILEGDKSMVDSSYMSRKTVQGALIHLELFVGIPVMRSLNIQETATLISTIFHQCQKEKLPRQKHIISLNQGIRINNKQRQKLFMLQNIPGIGSKKGLALLQRFGSIENIVNASQSNLMEMKGIGKKLADHIYTILHQTY